MKLLSLKCCLCLSRSFSWDHLLTRTPPHFALPILTSACNRYHDIFHTKIFSNEKITDRQIIIFVIEHAWILKIMIARSSWLNCATLRDYEAEYWVSIGHFEAVAVGNWWYWVSRGHSCLYILQKVEIWKGVTHAWLTSAAQKIKKLSETPVTPVILGVLGGTKNGTSGAWIKILRPLFNTNTPPKTPI